MFRRFLDRVNRVMFRRGTDRLFCTKCFRLVSLGGSYSNKGAHAACYRYVDEGMKQEGMDFISEYCQKHIWIDN